MPNWSDLARQPLAQSLVVSLGIHLALLAFMQPSRGTVVPPQPLVIHAHLGQAEAAAPLPAAPEVETPEAPPPLPPPPETRREEPPPTLPDPLSVPKPAPIQAMAPSSVDDTPRHAENPPKAPEIATQAAPSAEPAAAIPHVIVTAPPAPTLSIPSPVDTTWYLARQVDKQPKALGGIKPKYPESARRREQEGTLKLMVKIDDRGQVSEVSVVEAQPPGIFDEAALEAFRDARFQPAMKNGRPVRYEAYMRVEFRLE